MEDQQTFTKKRSESLTKDEHRALKAYRKQFDKEVHCATALRMDRNVLCRVLLKGSGAPETIEKIRIALGL